MLGKRNIVVVTLSGSVESVIHSVFGWDSGEDETINSVPFKFNTYIEKTMNCESFNYSTCKVSHFKATSGF